MRENTIKSIDEYSPLHRRVHVGDRLISINGNIIHDVLDYKFFAYDPELSLVFLTPENVEYSVHIKKAEGEDLGLDFESYLMSSPRSCANNCVFCFIDQLPKGMRPTLYFKDDDSRLSFLLGNYITMTNLSEREIQRIIDLRVSPINISVHATDPELRVKMLRNKNAGRCMEIMKRFAEGGIVMNCQIVCCPGLNDGDALNRTMNELAALYPAVHSVSIVPVGLTKYREGLYDLKPFTPEHSAETVKQVTEFGDECLRKYGSRIFFCSDEMYICAGLTLPEDEFYEEHTQLENGVGMIRLLEEEFKSALSLSDVPDGVPFSIACGVSVAPYFEKLVCMAAQKYDNIKGKVYAIENDFFGHAVNVTGLITGQDLINQLKGKNLGERLFISQNMLRREELDFLDDVTIEEASTALGVPIYPIEQDGFNLWDAISGDALPELHIPKRDLSREQFYKYNRN